MKQALHKTAAEMLKQNSVNPVFSNSMDIAWDASRSWLLDPNGKDCGVFGTSTPNELALYLCFVAEVGAFDE